MKKQPHLLPITKTESALLDRMTEPERKAWCKRTLPETDAAVNVLCVIWEEFGSSIDARRLAHQRKRILARIRHAIEIAGKPQ